MSLAQEQDVSRNVAPAPEGKAERPSERPSERTSRFLEGIGRTRREIITPEGVPISVELAEIGERVTAFLLDFVIQNVAVIVIFLSIFALGAFTLSSQIALAIALFIFFLIRNLYFVYFEIAWRGATPGKRAMGLRVIDRHGGPLMPSAVVARNLTREVEMFIPLGVLLAGVRTASGGIDYPQLSIAVWMLFFAALPLINRDRMRGGDMIAGTMVISLPKRALSSDLVERKMEFTFTEQQLRAYGAFELQVLEELLRRPDSVGSHGVLEEVCEKIRHRIGWTEPVPHDRVILFLRDFYTAERAFLEREQLYGKARADKFAQPR
jgi:uncharacterized RDD family membrane protein YckC